MDAIGTPLETENTSQCLQYEDSLLRSNFDEFVMSPSIGTHRPSSTLTRAPSHDTLYSHRIDSFSDNEISGLFQYIDQYKPRDIEIGTTLKPFLPEFIPALGLVDEFIKVPRPDDRCDDLGLKVLDEDGPKQSDAQVLMLQLRSASSQPNLHPVQVPSIDLVAKNPQKLEGWIKSIKELHCNEPPPTVNFSKPMPKMEMLKQEWPPTIEKTLNEIELPSATLDVDLATFVDICCLIFDIPVYESRVESLHLFFSLYLELKCDTKSFFGVEKLEV